MLVINKLLSYCIIDFILLINLLIRRRNYLLFILDFKAIYIKTTAAPKTKTNDRIILIRADIFMATLQIYFYHTI